METGGSFICLIRYANMERVNFAGSDVKVSPIGVGTYYDFRWIAPARLLGIMPGKERRISAIRAAIDSGINLIDTAEIYQSEPLVAEAIKGLPREDLFLATKVWPANFSYEKLIKSCERSLRKLNTSYIDLYQMHFPSSSKSKMLEGLKAMEHLVDQGKIRYIGISNFSLDQTKMVVESLKKHPLSSTQMNFSVAHRNIEKDILPYCRENRISILAYFPLAHGKLTSESALGQNVLKEIERNHGKKSITQIALNWFISKYNFVFPIPRASNPDHVRENAGAMGWRMTPEEIALLESSVAGDSGPSSPVDPSRKS